tara:strand:+ start:344 stop:481 length:138 start_codon:yes stop_codon:yes gene_type:complete
MNGNCYLKVYILKILKLKGLSVKDVLNEKLEVNIGMQLKEEDNGI